MPSIEDPSTRARAGTSRALTRILFRSALVVAVFLSGVGAWRFWGIWRVAKIFEPGASIDPADATEILWDHWLPDVEAEVRRGLAWPVASLPGNGKAKHWGLTRYVFGTPPGALDEAWIEERIRSGDLGTRAGALMLARARATQPVTAQEIERWIARLDGAPLDQAVALQVLSILGGIRLDRSLSRAVDLVQDDRRGEECERIFGASRVELVREWRERWESAGHDPRTLQRQSLREIAVRHRDAAIAGELEPLLDDDRESSERPRRTGLERLLLGEFGRPSLRVAEENGRRWEAAVRARTPNDPRSMEEFPLEHRVLLEGDDLDPDTLRCRSLEFQAEDLLQCLAEGVEIPWHVDELVRRHLVLRFEE